MECFWRNLSSTVYVMKNKQILYAVLHPSPDKNNPTPAIIKFWENPTMSIPRNAIPKAIICPFFLPILSTIKDIETYPQKLPT